jgi:hypothetical protein
MMSNKIIFVTKTRLFPILRKEPSNNQFNDENRQNFVSCPSVASFVAFENEQEKLKNQQKIHFERQKSVLEFEKENSRRLNNLSKSLGSTTSLFPGIGDVKGNPNDTDSRFDFVSEFFEDNEIVKSRTDTTLTPAVTLLDFTQSLRIHKEKFEIPKQTKSMEKIINVFQKRIPNVIGKTKKQIPSSRGHYE